MAESNGNTPATNGVSKEGVVVSSAKPVKKMPKWGGAEICPRCDKSVSLMTIIRLAATARIFFLGLYRRINERGGKSLA